ncbi:hypothetical protein ACHAW6_003643 [Cyclotella cf. meneghiniana]
MNRIPIIALLTTAAMGPSDATFPTMGNNGADIVFESPVMNWTFSAGDTCYFQAHKFSGCWVWDIGACIECMLSVQADPNDPRCDTTNRTELEGCAYGNCHEPGGCGELAMGLFDCVIEEECSDTGSDDTEVDEEDVDEEDVCSDEVYEIGRCLDTTGYYDIDRCMECVYAGQSDPDDVSCDELDCGAIGACRDTYCDSCEDEFNAFSDCTLFEACDIACLNSDDACYDQFVTAHSCAATTQEINACVSCYTAGQTDPHNPICDDTDCDAYLECLDDKCSDCVDEYMSVFACLDEESQCDVVCSDYRRLARHRSKPRPPHHFRGSAKRRGPRVNGPPRKPHRGSKN